jgi:hypothetical protein
MKTKKFTLLFIFIFLTNCGYQPIHLQKDNLKIFINEIDLEGDKKINRKIMELTNLKKKNNGNPSYNLKLISNKDIKIVAKDKSGNASIYKTTVTVIFTLEDQNEIFKQKTFSSNFSYNDIINSFELSQYQKTIENNLINKIAEEILIFINA